MEKNNNMIIESLVKKAYLLENEAMQSSNEKKVEMTDIDKIISEIRTKITDLQKKLVEIGVQPNSEPIQQLKLMYKILAEQFDPVESKMQKHMQSDTSKAAAAIVQETKKSKKVKYYDL